MIRLLILILLVSLAPGSASAAPPIPRPKLILTLVIDQFRADYLLRFHSRFKPARGAELGGFEYLMSQGAYYPFGQYDHLNSVTAAGHATILTGAYPYQSGIPMNNWFSAESGDMVYCTEDKANPPVGAKVSDPHTGTSPKNLIATTVGDELKNAGYPSKVVALALKDRAAILLGGHRADLAFWLDGGSNRWISSKFYLPDGKLPEWLEKLNAEVASRKGESMKWVPQGSGTGFSAKDSMALPSSYGVGELGVKFPHEQKVGDYLATSLPYGVELTVDAAERALDAYKLGQGRATDLLGISFSTHDYLGHGFGPNARELEEITVVEDREISRLLNYVNRKVPGGLKNVVVVLTGDHGVAPNPDYLRKNRIEADRVNEAAVIQAVNDRLNEKFGKPSKGNWVVFQRDFNFYLSRPAIQAKKLAPAEAEAEAKAALLKFPWAAHVVTESEVATRRLPPGQFERQILKTWFRDRSGDVIVIPRPFYILDGVTADHLTGYSYDRTVPIILAGEAFKPGRYSSRAEVVDIAPTLSFLAGVVPPALSEGRVLTEALR